MMETLSNKIGKPILAWVLYVLAGVTLLVGVVVLVMALSYAANASNSLMALAMVIPPAFMNIIARMVSSAAVWVGVIIFLINAALSLVLFAAGRQVVHSSDLAARVARLEQLIQPQDASRP